MMFGGNMVQPCKMCGHIRSLFWGTGDLCHECHAMIQKAQAMGALAVFRVCRESSRRRHELGRLPAVGMRR